MGKIEDKHFVVFSSPGTLYSENTSKPIKAWDTKLAIKMSEKIEERYGATPFGFHFETRRVSEPIDDGDGGTLTVKSKLLKESGYYYIKGRLRMVDEVREEDKDFILLSNMECNDWPIVVETTNRYKATHPFEKGDFVVDGEGNIIERGDDPKHVQYRKKAIKRIRAERKKSA